MTEQTPRLRPIGFLPSLLWFGIPAALFSVSILGVLPWMVRSGYGSYATFYATFCTPLALMLGAVFVVYRLEGNQWTWPAFRDRLRLQRMTGTDWLWTVGLILGTWALQWLFGHVTGFFAGVKLYDAPAEFGAFMANLGQADFGFDLTGRWDVLILMSLGMLVFNIGGEELWWRGIILPRQELAFGKRAWIVNGVLWDLFHIFYHATLASVIGYLPATVPLAWVAQRRRSTWPGIIAHYVGNIGLPIAILYKVLGQPLP